MNDNGNLAIDNTCESDEDLPLVIDSSYENDEVESSPVTDDVSKLNGMESETIFRGIQSACLNTTNTILLDEKKCATNGEKLGHLEKNGNSSFPIRMEQDIDSSDHISTSDDEAETKATSFSEAEEGLAQCDIKIEYNELLIKEESLESVDTEFSMSDNLSNEPSNNDSQPFKCDICPYQTSDETYFVVHKKTHRNKYRCNACFYVSTSVTKLLRHQKKRHMSLEDLLYYCGDCSFSSRMRVELQKHRRENHSRKAPDEVKFKCPDCPFKSSRSYLYIKHRANDHMDSLSRCEFCRKLYLSQDALQRHSLVHTFRKTEEGLYKCNDCEYCCKNKCTIKYHIRTCHRKRAARNTEFTCELCSYKTSRNWRLKQHLKHHKQGSE